MRNVTGGHHRVYDLCSDSWRVASFDSNMIISALCSSLQGNAYFLTEDEMFEETGLRCFDFTRECFGPYLPLPFQASDVDTMVLSCVRDEQLAALYQQSYQFEIMEIWITTLIQPDAASWTKFLRVELNGFSDRFMPVDIREATTPEVSVYRDPFFCTSAYVPTLLQLGINQPDKDAERTNKKLKIKH